MVSVLREPETLHFCLVDWSLRVQIHAIAGVNTLDEWPNVKVKIVSTCFQNLLVTALQAWFARFLERPAVKAGMQVP